MSDDTSTKRGSHFANSDEPRRTPRFSTNANTAGEVATSPASNTTSPAGSTAASVSRTSQVPSPEWDDSRSPASVGEDVARALDTLAPGQGAVVTTRDTAQEAADAARQAHIEGTGSFRIPEAARPQVQSRSNSGRGKLVAVVFALIALLALAAWFIVPRLLGGEAEPETVSNLVTEAQVGIGESIEYGGYSYQIQQTDEGKYVFTRINAGSAEPLVLFEISGDPVALLLGEGAFLVPENLQDGWDVIAYTMGDGSEALLLMDENGNPLRGSGHIDSASIEGSNLVLVDSTGESHSISLA